MTSGSSRAGTPPAIVARRGLVAFAEGVETVGQGEHHVTAKGVILHVLGVVATGYTAN